MGEEKKTGLADAVETGASAAHTIKGAIKAGKAIPGAAKGAAAGGPYGAVAGAVWAGRKHIGKIIAVIIILLLLPVLFVLMLPGLIFGGLVNAFSPADSEAPVLNSETAIVENANDITFTINSILGEALDDVMARIEEDFASSGVDHMEIKNSYSSGPVFNANLIISQYCAARDEDFESISLDDLAAVLRDNKEHLYSYTSVQESREVTTEDPETGEETTTTETWIIYTIRYNGESYLADHVFALTDEQKKLASDYASNLSTFLGDGLLQNMTEWTGNSIPSLGDVTFTDGVTPVVYYNQLDERYASQPYGTDNIGGYGCGPTSMAIVVSSLTDDTVDPVEMAQWSYENGYWCDNSGSYHALIPAAAEAWGLPVSGCTTSEPQRIVDALSEGKLVVAIMAEGHFTSSGHFIVLRGVKDGQIMVADPASYKRSEQLWDLSIILNEASRRAGAGGPFWITGRIRLYNVDDFDHADITFGKDAAIRCDLLRIVPLSKTETGADDPNNIPPNKQPIDPRIWYENSGRTVLEALVADLNSRGHSKLTLRENGDICIQQGEELVPQEHLSNFPAKVYWPRLVEVFESNGLSAETTAQGIQVSW